ncbi:MAG: hypothetical protein HGB12_11540 [Bacteroidetes bacterium]|nr:hypothetical protein [Bacteroidota bacterium]
METKIKFFIMFVVLTCSSFTLYSQKCTYNKTTQIVSDGTGNLFKLESVKSSTIYGAVDFFVKNLDGKDLIYLKVDEYKDPQKVTDATPEGRMIFFKVTFLNNNTSAEINYYLRNKKVAEILYQAKLIVNGQLDVEAQNKFVIVNGNSFSKRRDEIYNNNTIIINNNTQLTPSGE